MISIKFSQTFYNGKITPYALISTSTEFLVTDSSAFITIEQENYLNADKNLKTEKICGTAAMQDIDYHFSQQRFETELNKIIELFENHYKEEFFINSAPHNLSYFTVKINDKNYNLSNLKIDDEHYKKMMETFSRYINYLNVPRKLLKQILKNKPFNKKLKIKK